MLKLGPSGSLSFFFLFLSFFLFFNRALLWWHELIGNLPVIVNYMQSRALNKARQQICLTPRLEKKQKKTQLDSCDRAGQSEEGKNNPTHVTILFQEAWKQTLCKWIWKEWDEARGLNLSCSFVTDLAWSGDLSLDKEKTLAAEFCQSLVLCVQQSPHRRRRRHRARTHTHTHTHAQPLPSKILPNPVLRKSPINPYMSDPSQVITV